MNSVIEVNFDVMSIIGRFVIPCLVDLSNIGAGKPNTENRVHKPLITSTSTLQA